MSEPTLKKRLAHLYLGRDTTARRFRFALIAVDLLTILYFILTAPLPPSLPMIIANMIVGLVLLADFCARLWIAPQRGQMLRRVDTITDVVVIASLLLAPLAFKSFAFLRIVRAIRLLRSYHVVRDLKKESSFFRANEDVIVSSINLLVFIFLVTAVVFVVQFGDNQSIANYVDALYFTVTTLTTTGFGDIILTGTTGRLLSVVIMVVGVALFLRLVQSIFRPQKIHYKCPDCGLSRHDQDAVHCKHCGHLLNIETEGSV